MDTLRLGRTNITVTKNGFGALPIQRIDKDSACKLLKKAYDSGINYFDTARAYTDSEEKLGLAFFNGWIKREDVYTIEGSVMNRMYGLTGTNAYPETDCTLVCVKLADMEHPKKVAIPRFHIGGRWFADIVDSNDRREGERTGTED